MKDYFIKLFNDIKELLPELLLKAFLIVFIFVVANIIMDRVSSHTKKAINKANQMDDKVKGKSIVTTMTMTRSVCRYAIYFVAILVVMNVLGFGSAINNVLVTAGVGAMIVSFGAQSLIKDVITGILLLFEKQYSVGDYVKINEYEGFVTSIAMRVTNKVIEVLKTVVKNYYEENKGNFLSEPIVQGVSKLNDSSVDVYINGKVKPLSQWSIEREIRLLILNSMKENGFEIPFNQIDVNMK